MRSDGLSAVLRPLLDDRRIVAATLVDVDSGLILDGYVDDPGDQPGLADLELLGASHADMVKAAQVLAPTLAELTVSTDDGHHHVLHAVPDPHGERLVVAVVVRGAPRHVTRARLRLRTVSVEALTAGPTLARRPVDGSWVVDDPTPESTATDGTEDHTDDDTEDDTAGRDAPADVPASGGAPLSAMAPHGVTAPAAPTADRAPSATVSSVASSLATELPGGLSGRLSGGLSSRLVPLSDARPGDARRGTARTGPAGR
ncbi:hypothetical protein PHK61_03615 [Actinomycetospora lutea]|uniref:hypothetical protein n=1 Tax=Actinomycetospora lutea TaxID=663604 RepID=UPI00236619A5|nr:hypothetical protein [Actinomycetospora lutea]MDD7937504.1 hypothetical protein [Actinomycetospora lutea]